ncbi:MAG: hypothetical protein ACOH2L_03350 [Devosia sp.]
MEEDTTKARSYVGWPLILGLALIAMGIVVGFLFDWDSVWHKIIVTGITELGFAFLISHVIIVTVDRNQKSEFSDFVKNEHKATEDRLRVAERRLSSRAVISHLLDVDLPTSITNEIEQYILSSSLIKRQQSVRFMVEPLGSYTCLRFEAEALFYNPRDTPQEFRPPYTTFGEDFINGHFSKIMPKETFGRL